MTRRMLLASRGQSTVIPDPIGGGGGDPDPDPDPPIDGNWPTTTDPNILALRPTGRHALVTKTATPGTAVGDWLADISTEIDPLTETSYGEEGPEWSGVLFLPPGEYQGGFGTGRWLSIVGMTGNPEDVIIYSDTSAADGVYHPYTPVHLEGVTLKAGYNAALGQSPKYCAHIGGSYATTFVNVIFDASEASPGHGNAGSVGMDGGPGTVLTFYKCEFIPPPGATGPAMNLHGGGAPTLVASKVSFIDCIAPNGVAYNAGVSGDINDELYVIGGDIGMNITPSSDVDVFTDLDNPVLGTPESVTRDHTTWPVPDGVTGSGMIDFWDDYFYPSRLRTLGTSNLTIPVTDTAPMTPVAGRTYYCPIPIDKMSWLNRFGIHVRSTNGSAWGLRVQPDPGITYNSFIFANRPDINAGGTGGTLPNGRILTEYYYSYILFPATPVGGNRLWVIFKIDNTTGVTIDGSAQLPGLHKCWYSDDDGTTLVEATAGTPFPLAHAAQVR